MSGESHEEFRRRLDELLDARGILNRDGVDQRVRELLAMEGIPDRIHARVREGLAAEAEAYRSHLERMLSQFRWATGVLAAILVGGLFFVTGRTMGDLEEHARQRVDDYVIDNAIVNSIEQRLRGEIEFLLADPAVRDEMRDQVWAAAAAFVDRSTADEFRSRFEQRIAELDALDVSDLVLPPDVIVPWQPSGAPNVPPGWQLCDGTADTPDLQGRLLIGATGPDEVGQQSGTPGTSTGPASSARRARTDDLGNGNGDFARPNHTHVLPSHAVLFLCRPGPGAE